MSQRAIDLVRQFPQERVFLIGDALLDTYLEGEASRLCREGPVPLLWKTREQHAPGGAANVAANLKALNAHVSFLSVIGNDYAGSLLRGELEDMGIDTQWLLEDDTPLTPHKMRILAEGQYVIRLDDGARQGVTVRPTNETLRTRLHQYIEELYADCDVVVISDYHYGVVSQPVIEQLTVLASRNPKPILIDSQALQRFQHLPATVVTPNHAEAQRLVELGGETPAEDWEELAQQLHKILHVDYVAITLAEHGVYLRQRDAASGLHVPTRPVENAQDVGAGDSFAAAFSLALAAGGSIEESAQIGLDNAGIAVTKPRTAFVSQQELLQRASLRTFTAVLQTQEDELERLRATLEIERLRGKTIVFTNGVFDILHAGHIHFLRQARQLGDVLVVAINSDRSTRSLKGPGRPIHSEQDRLALVAALDPVNYILLFDEDTSSSIISTLRPDVYVKGGDYSDEAIPEAAAIQEAGCRLVILPLVGSASTSNVIERIVATQEG